MFKSIIALLIFMCLLSRVSDAQSIVLSEDAIPPAGVSVFTSRGQHTVSDEQGRYSIHVRMCDTVLLSMIGYLPAKYVATRDLDVKRYVKQQPLQLTGVNIVRYKVGLTKKVCEGTQNRVNVLLTPSPTREDLFSQAQ